MPLKSILKGSKNAQPAGSYGSKNARPAGSYGSEGEILASKKIVHPLYNIPGVLPRESRLGKYALGLFTFLPAHAPPIVTYLI